MVSKEDVEELMEKLCSEKAKVRKDAIKELNSYLSGSGGGDFIACLDQESASLYDKRVRIPAASWPGVLQALCQCILTEVLAAKKRPPETLLAKTFKLYIQKAEETKREGGRLQMGKKTFHNLVDFFMSKAIDLAHGRLPRTEEGFRNIATLHMLLQHPPRDLPEEVRDDVFEGFTRMFPNLKDDGRYSEKMLAALNAFLLSDGLDLGDDAARQHAEVHTFMHSTWLNTTERRMKATLVAYARLQMQLQGFQLMEDETGALSDLVDLVSKDLDQGDVGVSGRGAALGARDKPHEEQLGGVQPHVRCLLELAAVVFSEAARFSYGPEEANGSRKRRKKQPILEQVLENTLAGKGSWPGAFCLLVHRRHAFLPRETLLSWLQALAGALPGFISAASASRAPEPLAWMLRCIVELAAKWPVKWEGNSERPAAEVRSEGAKIASTWGSIWEAAVDLLLHQAAVPMLSEGTLRLLGCLASRGLVEAVTAPPELFELRVFTETCTHSAVHFVAAFFSALGPHFTELGPEQVAQLRSRLLSWSLQVLSPKTSTARGKLSGQTHVDLVLLQSALLALAAGFSSQPDSPDPPPQQPYWERTAWWSPADETERAMEEEIASLDRSGRTLACFASQLAPSHNFPRSHPGKGRLPGLLTARLMSDAAGALSEVVLGAVEQSKQQPDPVFLLETCAACARCLDEVEAACKDGSMRPHPSWGPGGPTRQALACALATCTAILNGSLAPAGTPGRSEDGASAAAQKHFTPQLAATLETLVAASDSAVLTSEEGGAEDAHESEALLDDLARAVHEGFIAATEAEDAAEGFQGVAPMQEDGAGVAPTVPDRIYDDDLDVGMEAGSAAAAADAIGTVASGSAALRSRGGNAMEEFFHTRRLACVRMMAALGRRRPVFVADKVGRLLRDEKKGEVRAQLLSALCEMMGPETVKHLPVVVTALEDSREGLALSEESRVALLRNVETLSARLASEEVPEQYFARVAAMFGVVLDEKMGLHHWRSYCQLADALAAFMQVSLSASEPYIDALMALMKSPHYRVRRHMARLVPKLLASFRDEVVLDEIIDRVGVPLPVVGNQRLVTFAEVQASEGSPSAYGETAVLILAEAAAASEVVEPETVFMLCAHGAAHKEHWDLVAAVLDCLARRLGYSDRHLLLEQHLPGLLSKWVAAGVPLMSLVAFRGVLHGPGSPREFLLWCMDRLLGPLLLAEDFEQLERVAELAGEPLPALLRQHFATVFATISAVYCEEDNSEEDRERLTGILQSSMLEAMEITEAERDDLLKRFGASVVTQLLALTSAAQQPQPPFHSGRVIGEAICTLVDGMILQEERHPHSTLQDTTQILRADKTFRVLLQLHLWLERAASPRHKRGLLAGLGVLVNVLGQRVTIPSTFRYMAHIVLQHVTERALQAQCCELLRALLDQMDLEPDEGTIQTLGDQLQFIVSKLVSCCFKTPLETPLEPSEGDQEEEFTAKESPLVFELLRRLTVDAPAELHEYIRDLDPFPDLPVFEPLRELHAELRTGVSLADDFVHFVDRAALLPPQVRARSLVSLREQLQARRAELFVKRKREVGKEAEWQCRPDVVAAAWRLVQQCDQQDNAEMRDVAGAFLAAVGLGDARAVAFHPPVTTPQEAANSRKGPAKPAETEQRSPRGSTPGPATEEPTRGVSVDAAIGVSDSVVREVLELLQVYLLDDDVSTISAVADTLKGLLATDKGAAVLESLPPAERAYLDVHTRGVSLARANEMLRKFAEESAALAGDVADPEVWRPEGKTHEQWVSRLVHALIERVDDGTLRLCQPMALRKGPFAELLLSHVLGAIAAQEGPEGELYETVSRMVQECVLDESNTRTRAIQVMLEALNSLRQCHVRAGLAIPDRKASGRPASARSNDASSGPGSEDPLSDDLPSPLAWPRVYYFDVDYLAAAKAAQQCSAFFTSLLYVEHWCEQQFGELTLGAPDFSDEDQVPLHEQLLLNVYAKVNEPDGIYGVARTHKAASQLRLYEHEGSWGKALGAYDDLLRSDVGWGGSGAGGGLRGQALGSLQADIFSQGGGEGFGARRKEGSREQQALVLQKGLMRSLQQMGCLTVLDTYWQGLSAQKRGAVVDPELVELQYENAWRMGQWDLGSLAPGESPGYNAMLHGAFKALGEGNREAFQGGLTSARQGLVRGIAHTSAESTQSVNPAIVRLQILEGMEEAWELKWPGSGQTTGVEAAAGLARPTDEQMEGLEEGWQERLKQVRGHFELLQPLLEVRGKLLELLQRADRLPAHFLELAQTARKAGHLSAGAGAIHHLKTVAARLAAEPERNGTELEAGLLVAGRSEEAKILWAQGQREMAVNLATYLAGRAEQGPERAPLLTLAGKWHAETRSASSRVILDDYLLEAAGLYMKPGPKGPGWKERRARTYFRCAHYADTLYRNYELRTKSAEYQAAAHLRRLKTAEYDSINNRLKGPLNADDKQAYKVKASELYKQLLLDQQQEARFQADKDEYLRVALKCYSTCLRSGDKYDTRSVFRLIALWFSLAHDDATNAQLAAAVRETPSHKFLPLVYQIASRMSSSQTEEKSSFQTVLQDLVLKLTSEHPYHSLYQVLALKHGDRVKDVQRNRHVFVVDVEKQRAAEEVLRRLPARLAPLLQQVLRCVDMYISLAEAETKKEDQQRSIPVPRSARSVRNLELVPVITAHIPVDPSCQYAKGTFPYFCGLTDSIKVMNGINAPKLIECLGSDGQRYRQLAKSGNDDLRQDAVMEQLFGLVSGQLQAHPETRKRQLNIRTYKVIPFTPTAGVLEWVNGTVPLGEYLLGSNRTGGAHGRYGSKEWTFVKCRELIVKATDKREAFDAILANTKPVFHHFFLERFSRPADWFEKRLAYARSVAASSMVGYIIGLGDRHSMNILLDEATAEVVHIDLGVAFEQGLMLKTPERVPFRLTRDIVAGLGVCGVQGVFRRCCEETLAVMRANKEQLTTIVEVFIHDPLYKWALSPLKALQRQRDESPSISEAHAADVAGGLEAAEGNTDATRALLRVKEKLDGYEEGEMRSLQGQVQQLIQDAQDPERLCQMFPGWGSWI
ncbi:Protein kinase ATM/Tel1 [Klebsormidium nitens]|uniref:Serine/threonine-protein kinase ATM n=1 Tax=Klebsormidium nitens TaxID=105231 RepID=A0A1Y1ICA0_KLENI|nr:Protein kinase ATM/Tel1 [Klebsormidium nitens]|eukprot:GAQ86367.1 Protein kinase ATM/Tel1 [Klebsormidium nitens]